MRDLHVSAVAPAFVAAGAGGGPVHALDFASNGIDADGWALRPDGGPTALPAWEHVDPVLSSVAPLSAHASTTALTVLAAARGPSRRDRRDAIFVSLGAGCAAIAGHQRDRKLCCLPCSPLSRLRPAGELSGADCCGLSVTLEEACPRTGENG